MSEQPVPSSSGLRELRLALVCYGGVSLAIYMHGITKEIQKLVVAAAAFEDDPDTNAFPAGTSEHAYWQVLRQLFEHGPAVGRGVATRVVVDIISGTSAGGINGICLAKALATNRQQDGLRDVWFDRGNIATLLHGPRWIPLVLRFGALTLSSMLLGRPSSPLRSNAMSRWLFDAFEAVDRSAEALPGVPTLVPADDPSLQLFVPITDLRGYDRRIALDDPKFVEDRTHRHVLHFDFARAGRDGFSGPANHALAFAARATSSFPGAFAALSVDDYARSVPGGQRLNDELRRLFPYYEPPADPATTWFVDGGVLDNRPFRSTLRALRARPASTEVDRRLLFIEPDPKVDSTPPKEGAPSWLRTVVASLASIPREEPIIDDLVLLAEQNELVLRIREIIETSFGRVTAAVTGRASEVTGADPWPGTPGIAALREWRTAMEQAAAQDAGISYTTYLRLRTSAVLDRYANDVIDVLGVGPQSIGAPFIRNVWRRRAHAVGLLDRAPEARSEQEGLLQDFDLDYHERWMRFLIAGFSWWYRDLGRPETPPRADLDEGKRAVYRQIAALHEIRSTLRSDRELVEALGTAFAPDRISRLALERDEDAVNAYLAEQAGKLDGIRERVREHIAARLPAIEEGLYEDLAQLSERWTGPRGDARQDLLVRYLGFPFWDVLVYPVHALSQVGERDHVEVSRISPLDTRLLSHGQPEPRQPLSGVSIHHFGAFFDRAGREHDYLWGRLDAAERLVTLLLDDPFQPGLSAPDPALCRSVFEAIVSEEREALSNADALDDVERRVRRMGGVEPPGVAQPVTPSTEPTGT